MTFRQPQQNDRSRARTAEAKMLVRQAFIAAGRELYNTGDPAKVSLRQIAAQAGYAPAAIYQYFANQQALLAAIREHDMQRAADTLARAIATVHGPEQRVLALFYETVDYWLANMDHFLIVFPPATSDPPPTADDLPFGRSPVVQGILQLYYDTVQQLFDSLPRHPLPPRLATDTLLAAVYGTLVFPRMTRTMVWSDTRTMARGLVQSVLDQWLREACATPSTTPPRPRKKPRSP